MSQETLEQNYERYVLKPVMSPVVFVGGRGSYLFDDDGRRYLDMVSGFGMSPLGYGTEHTLRVNEAIERQMQQFAHLPYYLGYNEIVASLAALIASVVPQSVSKMFFCNSGSEAVEGAMRVARKAKGKAELIAPQMSFFGRTNGAASLTGLSQDKKGVALLPGVHHIPAPYCYRCSLRHQYPGCDLACARYVEDVLLYSTGGDVAALFIEPIFGDVGAIVPPEGYFDLLVSSCKKNGIALVIDETLTGLGRTGKMFACEHWGLEPDILILGKALGAGLPLGAFIVSEDMAKSFKTQDFSSSGGGNSAACTGSRVMIDIIRQKNLCGHVADVGAYLMDGLKDLMLQYPVIGDVRGRGFLVGVELVDRKTHEPATDYAVAVKKKLQESGVIVTIYGKSTLRLTPALTFSRSEAEEFLSVFKLVLEETNRATV